MVSIPSTSERTCAGWGQVLPVTFEVLDHVHGSPFEISSELGAHNERPCSGVGRAGLAKQVQACLALLPAETGLEGYPVDVEDHSSHLLISHRDGTDLFRMSLVAVSPL
jgi:hypothetical protein